MKIWKISQGKTFFDDETFSLMKKENIVSVYPETASKGQSNTTQGEMFLRASKGDIFYVCRSNDSIEFVGIFKNNRPFYSTIDKHEDWTDREYILLSDAKNKNGYDRNIDKWWSPKNNSTFIEIPSKDYKYFEKEFLKPVFNQTLSEIKRIRQSLINKNKICLNDICKIQIDFAKMIKTENYLFEKINSLDKFELKKLEYEYSQRDDIKKRPVVWLRKEIITHLLKHKTINNEIIGKIKTEITSNFEKNVFHAWKNPFRILYSLYFKIYGKIR